MSENTSLTTAASTTNVKPENPRPLPEQGVILNPRPWVPIGVIILGLTALAINRWLTMALCLFGLFLVVQGQLLRLQFAQEELRVWRGESLLRQFPYSEWLNWKLFWPSLPVAFYFREPKSIHLLPVLFDATTLREQLELHTAKELMQMKHRQPTRTDTLGEDPQSQVR